jgi:subtilase family serine protease
MPQVRPAHLLLLTLLFASAFTSAPLYAQSNAEAVQSALAFVIPHDRILQPVEDSQRISLNDNTLAAAMPAYETGGVDGGKRLDHMILVLKPDPLQEAALDVLTAAQQDPASPLYHQWLTPETYAEHFGVSSADIEQVQNWLERNGLQVEELTASHRAIVFSGTSAQVEATFQTTMKSYRIGGQKHIANSSDPMIPAALAPVVAGVASLHDIFSAPQHTNVVKARPAYTSKPEYTSGGAHYLSPADYATIYDIGSLYNQAYTGSGQTIAIVGRSDISLPDVRSFRSTFGLPAKDPVTILNGSADPGTSVADDVDEAMLDTEWSGAVAKNATIDFVTSASTATSDGVFLSAQYIVNHNLAPVMSVSYGLCEADLGSSANSFFNSLWQQAAAEGITVLVSAGDSGAAGCDSSSATKATQGRGVNGICSTPYSTCVGGTEFNDTANPSLYWSSTTGSNGESALSYIPENVWNESGSSGLWSTGGGVSTVYAKPSWQTGKGVPADGKRDVPDVSLTAAGHDSYLVGVWGALYGISGTSAASPSFAGIMAITAQKAGARLGNANPELYHLAASQSSGAAAVFHDVTSGNNTVPGVTGFSSAAGYDQSTGWGSVDADNLVTSWGTAAATPAPTPTLKLTLSGASMTLARTGSTTRVTTAVGGGLSSATSLSVIGLPSGLTASFSPKSIASPGSGTSVLTLTPASTLAAGSWNLTLSASAGGVASTAALAISLPGLAMSLTPQTTSLVRGRTLQIQLATTAAGGFNSALTLAVNGLPAGVTAVFAPARISAPGTGSSTLTLTASKTATLGSAKITVKVTGTGFSGSAVVPLSLVATSVNSRLRPL